MRTCNFQKILDPKAGPLIAIREFILARKSLGGIQTDLQCRVLRASELADRGMRLSLVDRLAEVPEQRRRKAPADSLGGSVRPNECAVGAPHLDRKEVGLSPELGLQLERQVRRDMELVTANELRPEHSVDVLRQTRAGVVEGLTFEGRREEPAEHRGPYEQDPGAREQEDMQKRDRAAERPATRILGGIAIALLAGVGAISIVAAGSWPPPRAMTAGGVSLLVGLAVTVAAVAAGTPGLFFAGTAGSAPTARRGLPAVLVRRGGDALLFDCGEGTQRQLLRSSVGLVELGEIFVTHFHADHILGLPGLFKTFSLRGRERPLDVYGPRGLVDLLGSLRRVVGKLSYEVQVIELEPGDVLERDGYRLATFAVSHGVPAVGWSLIEATRPGRFDVEAADALGVPSGPALLD